MSTQELLSEWNAISNFSAMFDKHCLIFDAELKSLHEASKRVYDILHNAYMRFERHRSLECSKSTLQYWEMKDLDSRFPQIFHCFKFGDVSISITKYKDNYTVCILGYKPDNDILSHHVAWTDFYGLFPKLEDAFDLFATVVHNFLDYEVQNGLF